jgi:DNA-directed RNA polymerase III subunit RPC1
VSRYNKKKLQERVRNGPLVHPGANLIRMGDGGFVKSLTFGDREKIAKTLREGDVVERHMEDGDVVLFNRQPSLHKVSIMAHRAKVMEWRTFRFNTCVCAPYNADFDGDEMNMHLPQTEEARAEAHLLMGVHNNLTTPRNGEPLVAASQDFLSASYMLTQNDQFFSFEQYCTLVTYFGDAEEHIDVPMPAIYKPIKLWTGKQVFSAMIRPNKDSTVLVNLETKEKNYSRDKHFCPNDGWVAFRSGELISGNVAKKTIGDGSKTGLLYIVLRDYGSEKTANIMDRWAKLCGRYMGTHRGLSIGISDVAPNDELTAMKHGILLEGYLQAEANIMHYERGDLTLRPGCNLLQSLEEVLNGILGRLRESAGQEAMKQLSWHNSPRIMAACGSKGSPLNISQMMSCVGQQAVGGLRIQDGFVNRTLPHFEYHSLTPAAKGFVANSFYTGLTATEFFFHAMGGREGLVDTAVKTAETGYMARRLMKALEDLSMQYDKTVRNSENTVVQFTYGDDGLNPDKMEDIDRPVDFDRLYMSIRERIPCRDEPGLEPEAIREIVKDKLLEERFQMLLPEGTVFLNEIEQFFEDVAKKQEEAIAEKQEQVDMTSRLWYNSRFTQKTFHFSGISSMNVTLGVPRLKEIINASKNISTPIITAKLEQDDNKIAARVVKAGIEKTTLGEVSKYIKEVYASAGCYISMELDMGELSDDDTFWT